MEDKEKEKEKEKETKKKKEKEKKKKEGKKKEEEKKEKKGKKEKKKKKEEKKKEEKKKSDRLHEIVVRDRNTQLLAPGQDFTFALKIYQSAHAKAPSAGRGSSKGGDRGSSSRSSSSSSSAGSVKKDTRLPIIIVPALSTSLLTLLNVKTFLCDGQFLESSVISGRGETKATKVVISRRLGASAADVANSGSTKAAAAAAAAAGDERTAEYLAIDNPSRLKPSDWERVVAVVALGKDWQFKGWHWNTPVDLFTHALGVYVKWDNEVTPAAVGKWNVKVLDLSKNRRHLDATSSMQFWQHLDNFVRINKPGFVRE